MATAGGSRERSACPRPREPSPRVTELRLQRALALLREVPTRRICDVALDAGFSDISHCNRLCRARFGDTPGASVGRR
jgi:transcriptional regulator GlxA family with amidase domain